MVNQLNQGALCIRCSTATSTSCSTQTQKHPLSAVLHSESQREGGTVPPPHPLSCLCLCCCFYSAGTAAPGPAATEGFSFQKLCNVVSAPMAPALLGAPASCLLQVASLRTLFKTAHLDLYLPGPPLLSSPPQHLSPETYVSVYPLPPSRKESGCTLHLVASIVPRELGTVHIGHLQTVSTSVDSTNPSSKYSGKTHCVCILKPV